MSLIKGKSVHKIENETTYRANKITNIPPQIKHLAKLEKMWIAENPLSEISKEIAKLQNLVLLDLTYVRLKKEQETFLQEHLPNCRFY